VSFAYFYLIWNCWQSNYFGFLFRCNISVFHSVNIKIVLIEQTGHMLLCLFLDWNRACILGMISPEGFWYHCTCIFGNRHV